MIEAKTKKILRFTRIERVTFRCLGLVLQSNALPTELKPPIDTKAALLVNINNVFEFMPLQI